MTIDFDAFADDILSTDAFGQDATYVQQAPSLGGGPITEPDLPGALTEPSEAGAYTSEDGTITAIIPIIFDNGYLIAQDIGIVGVGTSGPTATCKTTDVPMATKGDTLAVNGVTYYVVEARPDGRAFTVLILSREP